MMLAAMMPVSRAGGKVRIGSRTSSAMLTESSKPNKGVEGGGRAGADAGQGPEPGLLELERLPRVPVAAEQHLEADQDDEQQAGQLDQGDGDVDLDRLAHAAVVD